MSDVIQRDGAAPNSGARLADARRETREQALDMGAE